MKEQIYYLEIPIWEFQKLPPWEIKEIRKQGEEACQELANEFFKTKSGIDYIVFACKAREFYVVEKGTWRDVPSAPSRPFVTHLNSLEEKIGKIVFAFYTGIMVEGITDPVFDKEFEGY